MKHTQNHRLLKPMSKQVAMTALMAFYSFGIKTLSFFDKLLTVGCTPYENLNRGQLKRMYWLRYVAG